jgi:putative NIF3 family GTP cyclohydrolase 1 type 2
MGANSRGQGRVEQGLWVPPKDPLVCAGHLSVAVYESGEVHWHVARLDLASKRMTFPDMGHYRTSDLGGEVLAQTLNSASLQYIESRNSRYE